MDARTEPGSEVPDFVPDEMLAAYQQHARQTIRRGRASRFGSVTPQSHGDVWLTGLVVFSASVTLAGLVAAVIYAVVLWPWIGLYVLTPAGVLFAFSMAVALRTRNRWRWWELG